MTRAEAIQAGKSILIGALTIFLVSLLEGALDLIRNHGPEIIGGAVAAWRTLLKTHT